jgi:chromosome partitioning protein
MSVVMTRIVSTINLKGGTGKTLMTVALAEFLSEEEKCRVLVIDVDPQTNATVSLISQQDWDQRNDSGRTLAQLFKDKLEGTSSFSIYDSIIRNVSNIHGGIEGLNLLPSSLDLIDLQDKLPLIPATTNYRDDPVTVLEKALKTILEGNEYNYVLIDCPPNLGLITQNALKISDSYLIPVIPDILSTLGIPQIIKRVRQFANNWEKQITPLGIILSKVREINLHRSMALDLENKARTGLYPPVWETKIKEAARSAEAADFDAFPNTLKQKYGYGGYYEVYRSLVTEFRAKCPA